MKRKILTQRIKDLVFLRTRNRCEYCQTQAEFTAMPLEIDHVIPLALEGLNEENNLCLACPYCNSSKNDSITGFDKISGEEVSIYNPRTQKWDEHFKWSNNGEDILGTSSTGRVTVEKLKLNRSNLVIARKFWVKFGWHPPKD